MPEHRFREVMSDSRLRPGARLVYYFAREFADDHGYCYVPASEIADRTGVNPVQCSGYITELVKAGYLTRERARGLGKGRRKLGIVGVALTFFASAMISAAEPQASGASLTNLRPVVSNVPETDLSGKKRRRRRRRHDDAA